MISPEMDHYCSTILPWLCWLNQHYQVRTVSDFNTHRADYHGAILGSSMILPSKKPHQQKFNKHHIFTCPASYQTHQTRSKAIRKAPSVKRKSVTVEVPRLQHQSPNGHLGLFIFFCPEQLGAFAAPVLCPWAPGMSGGDPGGTWTCPVRHAGFLNLNLGNRRKYQLQKTCNIFICIDIDMYVYIYRYVCNCMYVYIYIYTGIWLYPWIYFDWPWDLRIGNWVTHLNSSWPI